MKNKFSALEMAMQVYDPGNYISIDDINAPDVGLEISELIDSNNPYSILEIVERDRIRLKAWKDLSEEAKQVLAVLLDCPPELIGVVTNKKSTTTNRKKLFSYLRKLWGERLVIKKIEMELKKFLILCK